MTTPTVVRRYAPGTPVRATDKAQNATGLPRPGDRGVVVDCLEHPGACCVAFERPGFKYVRHGFETPGAPLTRGAIEPDFDTGPPRGENPLPIPIPIGSRWVVATDVFSSSKLKMGTMLRAEGFDSAGRNVALALCETGERLRGYFGLSHFGVDIVPEAHGDLVGEYPQPPPRRRGKKAAAQPAAQLDAPDYSAADAAELARQLAAAQRDRDALEAVADERLSTIQRLRQELGGYLGVLDVRGYKDKLMDLGVELEWYRRELRRVDPRLVAAHERNAPK